MKKLLNRRYIMKKMFKQDKGFTLIEILIAIALLAVIAAIVVPNVTGFLGRGQSEAYKTDKKVIQAAVDAYYTDPSTKSGGTRQYPTYSGLGGSSFAGPGNGIYISFGKLATTTLYLNDAPESAGSGNATGTQVASFSGSYWWYVDSSGRVQSSPAYSGTYP